ncbi:hypothetical protein HOY80DRAFT_377112 [Tuber brumale]|nr:hypothetical protein HOY80DRAFT_377112 [Tuber brumale]
MICTTRAAIIAVLFMLLTSIMCGLVGCLIGNIMCAGFIDRTNSLARAPNIKGTPNEHLGTRFDSSLASEKRHCASCTKSVSNKHLGTVTYRFQHTQEYDRLFNSQGSCNKYLENPVRIPRSSEEFDCLYAFLKELSLVMEWRKRLGPYKYKAPDSNVSWIEGG